MTTLAWLFVAVTLSNGSVEGHNLALLPMAECAAIVADLAATQAGPKAICLPVSGEQRAA